MALMVEANGFFRNVMITRGMQLRDKSLKSKESGNLERAARRLNAAARWYVWARFAPDAAECAYSLSKMGRFREAINIHLRMGRSTDDMKLASRHFLEAVGIARGAKLNYVELGAYESAINAEWRAFDIGRARMILARAVDLAGKLPNDARRRGINNWAEKLAGETPWVYVACNAGLERAVEALKKVNTPDALAKVAKFAKFEEVIKGALNKTGEQSLIQICNENYQNGNEQLAGWAADVLAKHILSLLPKGLEMVALFGGEHAEEAMDNLRDRMMRATYEGNEQEPGVRALETAQCVAVFARVMTRTGYEDMYFGFVEAVEKFVELKKQRCGDDTPALNEDYEKLIETAKKLDRASRSGMLESLRLHEFLKQLERLAKLPEDLGAEDWARNAPESGM
ncbi:MAG: hypothetical protein PHS02_02680 [Candidatus ainarchaeum sp.]|nr:hypothetical protein [Candidatus ainarchaeum sp.]